MINIVGKAEIEDLAEHLGDVPLLSGRPLTLNMLLPFVRREVLWAEFASGERVVSFVGKLDDEDKARLQAIGLTLTEKGGVVSLAENEEALTGLEATAARLSIKAIWPGYAGLARIDGKVRRVALSSDRIQIGSGGGTMPDLQAETITWLTFNPETSPQGYLGALSQVGIGEQMLALLNQGYGTILLTEDENGIGYRLITEGTVDNQVLADILQSVMALEAPTTQTVTLPDGTLVDELRLDTALVTMNVENIEGGSIIRAKRGGQELIAKQTARQTIITNRPSLLDEPVGDHVLHPQCPGAGIAFVRPQELTNALGGDSPTLSSNLLALNIFSEIAISQRKMEFCY